ncbi:MAG: hypothetical protein K2M27_06255 [Muribaculaceae bacterium]|nr:hypothetical protein [Muribaculaceae bacterium]
MTTTLGLVSLSWQDSSSATVVRETLTGFRPSEERVTEALPPSFPEDCIRTWARPLNVFLLDFQDGICAGRSKFGCG